MDHETKVSVDPGLIFNLLTTEEQKTVLSKGVSHLIENDIDGTNFLADLEKCKQTCPISGKEIVTFLYAPIRTLRLPEGIIKILQQKGVGIEQICDFYKLKSTQKNLQDIPDMTKDGAKQIHEALQCRNLPGLAYRHIYEGKGDKHTGRHSSLTALYAFFEPEIRSIIAPREAYLLQAVEWGCVDIRDATDIVGLDRLLILSVLRKIIHALGSKLSMSYKLRCPS